MNVVLIGYRGSGKTSVGRAAAARLGWRFVDTDAIIEERARCTIAEIFANEGEADFRRREAEVVAEFAAEDEIVLSVGGGAVMFDPNVEALKAGGKLVWLTAPAEVLWRRISGDKGTRASRPNLTAAGGLDEVKAVLAQRESRYREVADCVMDTTDKSIDAVAEEVAHFMAAR